MTVDFFEIPHSAIIGAIRRIFSRSVLCKTVRERAKIPDETGPRGGKKYRCEICGGSFSAKDIQVDHKIPCVRLNVAAKDMSFDEIINRMWCPIDNLQAICKACHSECSKAENKVRRETKKMRKSGIAEPEIQRYADEKLFEIKGVVDEA